MDFKDVAGKLPFGTDYDKNDLLTVNENPDRVLEISKESRILFQFVPVERAADAIAAFPNGYFDGDLTPMQLHTFARHLEVKYGLALFGIGAHYVGFRRNEALDPDSARAIATDIIALYDDAPANAAEALVDLLTERQWLLFRYTEN